MRKKNKHKKTPFLPTEELSFGERERMYTQIPNKSYNSWGRGGLAEYGRSQSQGFEFES